MSSKDSPSEEEQNYTPEQLKLLLETENKLKQVRAGLRSAMNELMSQMPERKVRLIEKLVDLHNKLAILMKELARHDRRFAVDAAHLAVPKQHHKRPSVKQAEQVDAKFKSLMRRFRAEMCARWKMIAETERLIRSLKDKRDLKKVLAEIGTVLAEIASTEKALQE